MTASITDKAAAEIIRERVTMHGVLAAYGLETGRPARGWRRIPCPIHKGTDKNFSYSETGFKCFVCGARGGVIKFVEEYKGLPFHDALREVNAICGIGIPFGERDTRAVNQSIRAAKLSVRVNEIISGAETLLQAKWRAALDRFLSLDSVSRLGIVTEAELDEAYDGMMAAQEDIFLWERYGKPSLRDYADYLMEEVSASEREKLAKLTAATDNWKITKPETKSVPWRFWT